MCASAYLCMRPRIQKKISLRRTKERHVSPQKQCTYAHRCSYSYMRERERESVCVCKIIHGYNIWSHEPVGLSPPSKQESANPCIHICICVYTHIHTHTDRQTHTNYIYTYIHVYIHYVFVCVCVMYIDR